MGCNFLMDSIRIDLLRCRTRRAVWCPRSCCCASCSLGSTCQKQPGREMHGGSWSFGEKKLNVSISSLLKILAAKMSIFWSDFSKWAFLNNLLSVVVWKCKNSGQVAERWKGPRETWGVVVLVKFVFATKYKFLRRSFVLQYKKRRVGCLMKLSKLHINLVMVEYEKFTVHICSSLHLIHWRLRQKKPLNSSLSFEFIGLWVRPALINPFQIGLKILELELNFFH